MRFTAPSFDKPERVQIRYRLEGHDRDWIDAGATSYRALREPCHLAAIASSWRRASAAEDGASGPPRSTLVLQPSFFQRWSVRVSAAIVLLVGLAALLRFRTVRLRRRQRELEAIIGGRTAETVAQRDEIRAAHDRLAGTAAHLEQSHQQVLAVLNQLEIAALVLERDGIIRYATDPALRLLGSESHPVVGRAWSECLPLSDSERAQVASRLEAPPPSRTRLPVQLTLHGRRYSLGIEVRDEPTPGTGRILYLSEVTEIFGLRTRSRGPDAFYDMVGASTAMQLVCKQIRDVAGAEVTVLVEGETGSGKELVARAIHRASRRAAKPFVAVNTAGLTESLIASQLFGHRRGSFTGAVADQVGAVRSGAGGHAVSRRDWRHSDECAAEPAARPAGAGNHARR